MLRRRQFRYGFVGSVLFLLPMFQPAPHILLEPFKPFPFVNLRPGSHGNGLQGPARWRDNLLETSMRSPRFQVSEILGIFGWKSSVPSAGDPSLWGWRGLDCAETGVLWSFLGTCECGGIHRGEGSAIPSILYEAFICVYNLCLL